MSTLIKSWLEFSLQQVAAEAYIDQVGVTLTLSRVLQNGNNNELFLSLASFPGYTRLSESQANLFSSRYSIVTHLPNDASGFSATILHDNERASYTVAFRSSEYQKQTNGGDFERDVQGADFEIDGKGFALSQLMAMERFWSAVQQGKDSAGNVAAADSLLGKFAQHTQGAGKVNVTGYSLGGHLATVFTELHIAQVEQTYTFNSAGRGTFNPAVSYNDKTGIAAILESFNDKLLAAGINPAMLAPEDNIYTKSGYSNAVFEVVQQFSLTRVSLPVGSLLADPAKSKITQLFGRATHDDSEWVANSGAHGPTTAIFIEDQPNVEGLLGRLPLITWFTELLLKGDFGNTHSLSLLVDSLSVMEVLESMLPGTLKNQRGQVLKYQFLA